MKLRGDLAADIASGNIIPLRAIISGTGGPSLDQNVNLYYLHWWTLSQFLFHHDQGKYREGFYRIIKVGGNLESFERNIAPAEAIQPEWYQYLQKMRAALQPAPRSRSKLPNTNELSQPNPKP